ncbi:MAG: 3-oxoacyl-ACP synthase III [Planctomycetes bacterium]|nr:3-oxoacyl-ACP synthase III [Planctomycetota bacterium]
MRFEKVRIAATSHVLPEEVVTSEALECALAGVYARFRLNTGRLELMTGIRERRFFPRGWRPSDGSTAAGELALARSGVPRERIGLLVHAAVCRDFLEPATASVVHHRLGLPHSALAFDLSNACLGFANAASVVATQVELGAVDAGLVVAGECGRALVERTIATLNAKRDLTREELKASFASLTIGSGAAAMVIARKELCASGARFAGATARSATQHHVLCHGDHAGEGMLMQTDSETLMQAGNELAARTFAEFLAEMDWTRETVERVITHQVGVAHRKLLLGTMGIDLALDFPTVETLGNIGSVSLPLSWDQARSASFVRAGQRTVLMGIGSGLQCQMLALEP